MERVELNETGLERVEWSGESGGESVVESM